jgi:hypothetical protein
MKKVNQSTHQNLTVVAINIDNPPDEEEVMEMLSNSIDQ